LVGSGKPARSEIWSQAGNRNAQAETAAMRRILGSVSLEKRG
jgi:hypothetical protein